MGRILVRGVVGSVLTFKKISSEGNPKVKDPRTLVASLLLSLNSGREGGMGVPLPRAGETVQVPPGAALDCGTRTAGPAAVQLSLLASHCA